MFTEGNPISQGADSAMIVGKLTPPKGLYEALKQVRNGKPMGTAILLLFSKDVKGKIAIANNRVITGALVEGSGEAGQQAIDKMFAVDRGMYGVREAVENEAAELQQKLLLDIDQMLRGQAMELESTEQNSKIELDISDVDPGYKEWLQEERGKVFADLERSIKKGGLANSQQALKAAQQQQQPLPPPLNFQPPPGASPQMQHNAAAAKQDSPAKKWEGLDSIPTPNAVLQERRSGQPDSRPDGSPDRRATGPQPLPASTKISSVQQLKQSGKYKAPGEGGGDDATITLATATMTSEIEDMSRRRQIRIGLSIVAVLGFCGFLNFMMTHNEVNSVFADASKHYQKGEYKESIFLLSAALAKDPNNGRLHMQKGLAHSKLREYDDALKEFDLALAKGAAHLPALLARATTYSDKQEYEKAIAECQAILVSHRDCAAAYLLLAASYDHASQAEAAEKTCTEGLKYAKTPAEKANLLLERGYARSRNLNPKEAERDLTEAISLQPTLPMYMARGDVYKRLGRYCDAITDYSAVIERDPSNYNALVARGIAENYNHEEEHALRDFAEALKVNKHGLEALIQRGSLYLSRHAYKLAVNDLEDALKLNPQIAETQQKLDAAYKQLRMTTPKTVLALTDTSSSTPSKFKMPSTPGELIKVGFKYMNDGELDYAKACFVQAVKLNPSNEQARKYLAHVLFQSGEAAGAAAQFEALNSLSGVDDADILPFSQSLANSGHTTRAIQVLESYLQTNPRAVSYRCDLANLYVQTKQPGRAKAILAAGMRIPGTSAEDIQRMRDMLNPSAAPAQSGSAPCNGTPPKSGPGA